MKAHQSFDMLVPWSRSYRDTEVARANTDVMKDAQRLTLEIPAPPSDEELLRRKD